jgi:hypothetical protein
MDSIISNSAYGLSILDFGPIAWVSLRPWLFSGK